MHLDILPATPKYGAPHEPLPKRAGIAKRQALVALPHLDVLDREARRQALLELIRLLQIAHAEGVQVLAATDLELDNVLRLLDLDGYCKKRERTLMRGCGQETGDGR